MMIPIEKHLAKQVNDKLIKINKHPTLPLNLTCYTKQCFFGGNWCDETKNARGHVYDDNGFIVSRPFKKIFNMDEVPETNFNRVEALVNKEEYEVLEKSNGHLVILFYYDGQWINTTKGSWGHEFVAQDRALLESMGVIKVLNSLVGTKFSLIQYTFMFECIADYDPHTLHKQNKEKYGKDTMVLLGINDTVSGEGYRHDIISTVSTFLGCDVVEKYDFDLTKDIKGLYDHKNTEGYVVYFPWLNERVKIKTADYIKQRFVKELENGDKFKKLFATYFDNWDAYKEHLPEEYYYCIDVIKHNFDNGLRSVIGITAGCVKYSVKGESIEEQCKYVALSSTIHPNNKPKLFCFIRHGTVKPELYKDGFIDNFNWSKLCDQS